jgi:hypothetical protein
MLQYFDVRLAPGPSDKITRPDGRQMLGRVNAFFIVSCFLSVGRSPLIVSERFVELNSELSRAASSNTRHAMSTAVDLQRRLSETSTHI